MNFNLKFTDQEENIDLAMNGETVIKVPAYTSELENDSGFLTSIPGEYITEAELAAKGYVTDSELGARILSVKTAPTKYTTEVSGVTPSYRMTYGTIVRDAGVKDISVGDIVSYGEKLYRILFLVKGDYVYLGKEMNGSFASVTSEDIEEKLGYTPAHKTSLDNHKADTTVHVTAAEKQAWNNKTGGAVESVNEKTGKVVLSAADVGADPSGTAETKVSTHNTDESAHTDIRLLIGGLTTRLNTLANSDDITLDQMAEVVAYIKSNRTLIESVTTGKVNVADIVNNLTTNVSNKPLSAAQGVALKGLIDALQTAVGNIKVPTKTSELTNDSGFVTENPDLSIYATKENISDHNEQSDAHFDIRQLISTLDAEKIDQSDIVNNLTSSISNKPLSAAQGAALKKMIDDKVVPTKVSELHNDSNFATGQYVVDLFNTEVPKKTSQLTNDSGFVTEAVLSAAVPTKTSQLTNDSDFISTAEVVNKINEAISGLAGGLKFEIVDTIEDLPVWCDDSKTIYLVPSERTEGNQYYNEYLWMNGRWEKFGDTQISLSNYYTQSQVDTFILNVQKSIPTKISQLYNDAGYVKASEIETGEATWNSIKGNIIERIGTPITWDGNTDGREVYTSTGTLSAVFYKVSDIVVEANEVVGCTYYTHVGGDAEKTVPALGTSPLFGLYESEHSWVLIAGGMMCAYDDSLGCSPGIYFTKGPYEYDNSKEEYVTKFIVEADKIKPELLPDNVSVDMSKYFETEGGDTLTWDGNTEGKYTLDFSFMMGSETPAGSVVATKVSDATPTLEELNAGATIVMNFAEVLPNDALMAGGTISNFVQYQNFENVYVSEKVVNGNTTSNNFVIAVVTSTTDGGNGIVFEEGIYFVKMNVNVFLEGVNGFLFPTSATFNGYTFKKEVIKEECMPGMVVKSKSFADGTEMWNWMKENNEKALKYVLYMNGGSELFEPPTRIQSGDEVYFSFSKQRIDSASSMFESIDFAGIYGETHETYSAFHMGMHWRLNTNGTEVVNYGGRQEIPNEYLTPANGISCTVYYVD